ncbi:transcription factor hamlet-like [Pollicipes pollicipes]|uniref:transcription factor hamlet-like n=1 Tax=Pollicipes pollicipes TaxID=41117 RepID=UPI0018849322|nr:transcription factor hamlet-like [Pollicipes pollicipes]
MPIKHLSTFTCHPNRIISTALQVIEYNDIGTLKEQVKDIKTPKFSIKAKRPLKADLERIIHLEVRAADGSGPGPLAAAAARRGRPPAARAGSSYECRRCDIQFQDSREMVKHLQQHVSKPWCKRCRTEFPDRAALLEHRRACRLQHRSGVCTICDREVQFHRHHMKRHSEMVAEGLLEEGCWS